MTLINGKCEECLKTGKTSVVYEPQFRTTTAMAISPGYYDEQGQYHPPYNPNKTTYEWRCSNGHRWNEVRNEV